MADAGKKLPSMDASFLYLETPEMPMHAGSMAIFRLSEGHAGSFFEDFKAMIASRLHPELSRPARFRLHRRRQYHPACAAAGRHAAGQIRRVAGRVRTART